MEPITEDQERMLRCWETTIEKRRSAKNVHASPGIQSLKKEQSGSWYWEALQPPEDHEELPPPSANQSILDAPSADFTTLDTSTSGDQSFSGNFHSGLDMDLDLPSFPQEMLWSPIDTIYEEEPSFSMISEDIAKSNNWSPTVYSQRACSRSSAASLTDSCPLLSPPSRQSHANSIDRSSYDSSLRTWDTASTSASVYDPFSDDPIIGDFEIATAQTINPLRLTKARQSSISRFLKSETILEEEAPGHESLDALYNEPMGPPVPPKPVKVQGVYHCTVCQTQILRKGDWERHEKSHDPQGYWTCMLNDPAIPAAGGFTCVFCNCFIVNRSEMAQHLKQQHRFHECTNTPLHSRKKWPRKDKLRQHLIQVHSLSKDSKGWESWYREPSRRKWAWGCGFCGACSFTWEGRINHIAEHYERENVSVWQWSPSLVVKGLLKQISAKCPDFDVAVAWKMLVNSIPGGDQYLEWSKDNSNRLKRKLEYHEGTATAIATEARMLAFDSRGETDGIAWASGDSRVITVASPVDFNGIQEAGWRNPSSTMTFQESTVSNPSNFAPIQISNFI